jgi:hypothetical protein
MTNLRIAIMLAATAVGCERLGPRVEDTTIDAPPLAPDGAPSPIDAPPGPRFVLPAGTPVPHVSEHPGMVAQIRLNDGLSDTQLAQNGGVLARSTGKSNGATVMFWNFGPAPTAGNFPVVAPAYVLVESDGGDGFTMVDHPELIDSIPGDGRYSQVRRIMHVPITASYAGERITSVEALAEALELGLVGEPIAAGIWRNMPVVPPDTKLELGGTAEPLAPTEVYALGHRVTAFPLGSAFGTQPLRNNSVPIGQESRLLSGVASGTPPSLPTAADPVPVFQFGIPSAVPTNAFNYTPLVMQLDVRLATGVAPTAIANDAQLFRRSPSGSINGYLIEHVASFTVTTSVTNRQIQFQEGMP